MSKESISKIYLIVEKIEYIEEIISKNGTISDTLSENSGTIPFRK